MTKKDTFLALEGWAKQLENADSRVVVILIGNKVDLPNKVITSEMGSEYARQHGWGFLEVSAK